MVIRFCPQYFVILQCVLSCSHRSKLISQPKYISAPLQSLDNFLLCLSQDCHYHPTYYIPCLSQLTTKFPWIPTLTMQGDISTNYKVISKLHQYLKKKNNTHHCNSNCIHNYLEHILTRWRSVILILSEGQVTSVTQQFWARWWLVKGISQPHLVS